MRVTFPTISDNLGTPGFRRKPPIVGRTVIKVDPLALDSWSFSGFFAKGRVDLTQIVEQRQAQKSSPIAIQILFVRCNGNAGYP